MGLCKCPKRKVTNQFCFEHRVNVCEHCMVHKHPKCVVQSYLLWLQDSDYSPCCELCSRDLSEEVCVRLVCYHVFHWVCLDKQARSLPPDTAPAGYTCKICSTGLFPPDNLVSPVADALRDKLKEVNWARAGLGLPLLEARSERRPEFNSPSSSAGAADVGGGFPVGPRPPPEGQNNQTIEVHSGVSSEHHHRGYKDPSAGGASSSSSVVTMDQSSSSAAGPDDRDIDDNKYKRKSAVEMLVRWFKTFGPASRRRAGSRQRYLMIGLIGLVAFLTFLVVMSQLSGSRSYEDPMLEPMNNPNIHVGIDR